MKITEKIYDAITNEEIIIERDETAVEEKARLDRVAELKAIEEIAQEKALEKSALLARLGITEEEAKLLLS